MIVLQDNGYPVKIVSTDYRAMDGNLRLLAIINLGDYESAELFKLNGENSARSNLNLHLRVPTKQRFMTYQELAWWLRDCPEEHREYVFVNPNGDKGAIMHDFAYTEKETDKITDDFLIRSNGGEWHKTIIDE